MPKLVVGHVPIYLNVVKNKNIKGDNNMRQINTKEFASDFFVMIDRILHEFKYVGDWNWGDPAGQIEGLPTYEVISMKYGKVWCAITEWGNSSTGEPNRKGVLVTFPSASKQSLGHIMAANIPYEFKRIYNTRAYTDGNNVEIRNYGKLTVGRAGIKKSDFFDFMQGNQPDLVFIDEEKKLYAKVFEYNGELNSTDFADQIVRFTMILDNFKRKYR